MLGNYQTYEVNVKLTFEAPVFEEDPDDVFELADLEKTSVTQALTSVFAECEIQNLEVTPVIQP
jgi:hypothetical protein